MKRSPLPPRRTPLARQSSRRRAERSQRAAVVAEVLDRDGGCVAASRVASPCRGRLVVHETAQRSVVPGSHLRADLAVTLCDGHHDWVHANIAEARELGLLVDSWDVQP